MNEEQRALLDKAEELGWAHYLCDDGSVELEKYSPAGEDFIITIAGKDIAHEVFEFYEDFDPEEHCEMWVEARKNGTSGISNIRTLIDDAEKIDEMLKELAGALLGMEG